MGFSARSLQVVAVLVMSATVQAQELDEGALLSLAHIAEANDYLTGMLSIEERALAAAETHAIREGDRLVLRTKSGLTKSYRDKPECRNVEQESKCESYRLVAYAPSRRVFVVVHAHYEDARYIVIDDTSGEETVLGALPHLSPSGGQIVLVNPDVQQLGSTVQIWVRSEGKFGLAWSGAPFADATPSALTTFKFLGWNSDLAFAAEAEIAFDGVAVPKKHRFALRRTSSLWEILESPR